MMPRGRPRWARGRALTDRDRSEHAQLFDYMRRVEQAVHAGVPRQEAIAAIYPDVYVDAPPAHDTRPELPEETR